METKLCKTTLEQDDSKTAPIIQVQFLSQVKNAVNATPYGLHSSPELETPCLLITINNDSGNSYVLPLSFLERENISELKKSEVIVGNFTEKATILFDEDGNINISSEQDVAVSAKGDVTVDADGNLEATIGGTSDIDSTGDLTAQAPNINVNSTGNINITGGTVILGPATTIDSRVFLNHTHPAGNPPGNTGPVN